MLDKLGATGLVGLLLVLAGVAVIAVENLVIAGGLALVVAGLGVAVYGAVRTLASSVGLGGMV